MKRILWFIVIVLLVASGIAGWMFFGPATGFPTPTKMLYISSEAATRQAVLDSLRTNNIVMSESAFDFLAKRMNYWNEIKPGKYEIKKGASLINIIRKLRNG